MPILTGVTKFFPRAVEGFTTTLGGTISAGATSMTFNSTSGYSIGDVGVWIIEPSSATNKQVFTGTVAATNTVTNVVWTYPGTNVGHISGVTIVDYTSATGFDMVSMGIQKEHLQSGSHGNINTTSITNTGNYAQSSGTFSIPNSTLTSLALTNPYKFSVYLNTNTVIANTTLKVPFDTKEFDTGSNFDVATNRRFTAPVAGFYQISLQIRVGTNGMGVTDNFSVSLYKNGTSYLSSPRYNGSGDANILPAGSINKLVQLAANDYLEVFVAMTGSRDLVNGAGVTYFSGFLVSTT